MNTFNYGKCPKISNTYFHAFWPKFYLFMQLFLKRLSRIVNSADPDQTVPDRTVRSVSALFA